MPAAFQTGKRSVNRTIVLLGPADPKYQSTGVLKTDDAGRQRHEVNLKGLIPILNFIENDPKLTTLCDCYIVGKHTIKPPPKGVGFNVLNLVGDADTSHDLLRKIQRLTGEIQPKKVFNKPSRVFRTTRTALPETLAGIPGCRVPRVQNLDIFNFDELKNACKEFGHWPMILRARGFHGGQNMLKLEKPEELESIRDLVWLYQGILIMEFIDSKTKGDLYQKNRIVVIDGKPHIRHSIFSDQWCIHANSRSDLMNQDITLCREEEKELSYWLDSGIKKHGKTIAAIHERIGLDVFGIDFAMCKDQMLIFEANACMNIVNQDYGEDGRYQYLERYVRDLQRAIRKMILKFS
jgi:hypothetical protein